MQKLQSKLRTPDFSRLVKTLRCGQADVVPLIELGIAPNIKEAILGRPLHTIQDDIEFMSTHGYDYIKLQPKISFKQKVQTTERKAAGGYSNQPDRAWAAEHDGVVQNWEDFEKYPWPLKEDIDYTNFEKAEDLLPEGMQVIGQYGDIFTNAWEMLGFENFAMTIYEDPELIEAIMERVAEPIVSMFEVMSQMDWVGALWYSDDIAYSSSLMVSPDFLRDHFFPILTKISSYAKAQDKPQLYHTDGLLYDVIEDIIEVGVNGLHPIEPKAMDIRELKDKVEGRLCLCGSIEVDMLCRGEAAAVARLVEERIETVAPGGGLCIGSSNSVPDYAKVENYLAMVQTVHEKGIY